jgi:anti-sigma B factor antagonist
LRVVIDFGLVDEIVDDTTHVVSLRGEIDAMTAPKLGSRLFGLADEGKRAVVVDLSDVTFMDSTGIGVLLNALRHFTARHIQMVLVCPTARILRPFEVTGLVGHARILVAVLLEALGGAVVRRRRVALGCVRGRRVGRRRPLERQRLGGRVDGRRGRLGLLDGGSGFASGWRKLR